MKEAVVAPLLGRLVPYLRAAGGEPFLWGGTLLGHVREGRLLPWDSDVDIGVFAESVGVLTPPPGFEQYRETPVVPWMQAYGLRVGNLGWRAQGVKFGIHRMAEGPGGERYYTFLRRLIRIPPIRGLRPATFLGVEVSIPANADELLAWFYGHRWRRPDRSYCGSPRWRVDRDRWLVTA